MSDIKNGFRFLPFLLILLLGGIITTKSYAQLPAISFETITVKDGLPSNTILSATKDDNGFMWFGTRLCPLRYDGANFKSFTNPETNFVNGIAADKDNNIWFSSDLSGVSKIKTNTLEFTSIAASKKLGQTGFFFIDSKENGWYSDRLGANKVDLKTGKIKHYPFRKTSFVWSKASFAEDLDGNVWVIGRDNGLFKYDPKADSLICLLGADSQDPARREDILFSTGCVDRKGFLWLGSYNNGLMRYDPQSNKYESFRVSENENLINAVEEGLDENGRTIIWVGDKKGLGIFRPEEKRFYFFDNIFPEPFEVNDIFRDPKEGIIWACTSEGIVKYHPKANVIQSIQLPEGIVPFPVTINVFLQDLTDTTGMTFYLGLSHTGMLQWNRLTNEYFLIKYPSSAAETKWLVQRGDGTIWIGTNKWDYARPGIFVYDAAKAKFVQPDLSLLANGFFSVPFFMYGAFDDKNRLWIGNSDEGIHVLDEKTNREVTPWDSNVQKALLKNNNLINDFLIDRKGRTWLATYQGIYLADERKKKFVNFDSLNPDIKFKDHTVNSVSEDHKGNIWGARWGSITQMSDHGKIETLLNTSDGFFDRESHGLIEDYAGNIWIGNYEGLYCYRPGPKSLIRFTVSDGLINNNTVDRIFKSRDGKELLIGHKNSFNLVKLDKVLKPSEGPALAVSSFKIHEKEQHIDFTKPIQLKRKDNAFNVDFIALNFRKLHDNNYAYYLEGLEEDWNNSGSNHLAYYTNLNPGNYTLHLKAGDAFGNWNKNTLQLQISIRHAFYETWWFQTMMLLVFAGTLYGIYRYRINQILQLQKMRSRISADLHDELGSSLSGISIMGTLAHKNMPQLHQSTQFLEKIVDEVHQMSGSLDDIVWNINPKNDALSHLLYRMRRYASEVLEARQIHYELIMPENIEDLKLSMEQRRNFYMIFKESVNNLVKYSQCTSASITISIVHKHLLLTIKDNGIGFNTERQTDRNGLKNLKARTEALKGTIKIDSAPGKGTTIILNFPI